MSRLHNHGGTRLPGGIKRHSNCANVANIRFTVVLGAADMV